MPGTALQIGCQTLVNESSEPFDFTKFSRISNPGFDTVEFNNNIKLARERLAKGEVFTDTKPEDKIAKIFLEAHWARADFKRGWVNLKNSAKNKDWEKYELYKKQLRSSFDSLDRMIGALDDQG